MDWNIIVEFIRPELLILIAICFCMGLFLKVTTADINHHVSLNYIDMNEDGNLVDPNQLEAPTNLTATPSTKNITLNWDAVDGAVAIQY